MIKIINLNESAPYKKFNNFYINALNAKQKAVEAIAISSFNTSKREVESRFVNLKYINNEQWIFFSNYNSQKAHDFVNHDQISALLYWPEINIQIRLKGIIKKTDKFFSDKHFQNRSDSKNALAISSDQSSPISSYDAIVKNYENTLNHPENLSDRPAYWGGFSFTPYYFEFWEGHEFRLNKRDIYLRDNDEWKNSILQP